MIECEDLDKKYRERWAHEGLIFLLCNDFMGMAVVLWDRYRKIIRLDDPTICEAVVASF
jgi:hypothetical protein